jgi:adenylate cyclase class 2
MEGLETEVKFFLLNIQTMRNRILDLGADSKGRVFERNFRFEDIPKSLKQKKSLLRLRRDTKNILTFKSAPAKKDGSFKIVKELEVEVSDFDTMHHILEALGFHREQIYEKWRETFELHQTYLCLDTMPYGDFIEIEGQKQNIRNFASHLGLDWNKRILLNYLEIFEVLKKKLCLEFTDVTFDNFKPIKVNVADYFKLMEAGSVR